MRYLSILKKFKPWLMLGICLALFFGMPGLIYAGQDDAAEAPSTEHSSDGSSSGDIEPTNTETEPESLFLPNEDIGFNTTGDHASSVEVEGIVEELSDDPNPNVQESDQADESDPSFIDQSNQGLEGSEDSIEDEINYLETDQNGIDMIDDSSDDETTDATGGGNSYKAEIAVDGNEPKAGMNQDVELTITFTELGDVTPLGSARIYLNEAFTYDDYEEGYSTGLTVNSSFGEGNASGWEAQWEEINSDLTIALRAILAGDDGTDNYLGENGWVSVTFNATTPIAPVDPVTGEHVVGEFEFETAAWLDNLAEDNDSELPTNTNTMHVDHSDPQVQITPLIGENILTGVELKEITGFDDQGQPILGDLPEPMPHPDDEILDLYIRYEFELYVGHPYRAGSFYEFYLPEVFRVFNEVDGELRDSANQAFGTYHLDLDGKVTLLFNERIEGSITAITGFVAFNTEIVKENLGDDLEQIIEIEIKDNVIKEIVLSFEPNVASSIDKRGIPDRSYNTENITWEVDFNKDLQTVSDPVLQDLIQANLTLDPNSVALYELIIKLDGSVELGDLVDSSRYIIEAIDGVEDGDDFQLRFTAEDGETPTINSAYRIIFTTSIDDDDGTSYGNSATLSGSNIEGLTASATVAVGRGETLEKRSTDYNAADQVITWEIRANYNEKTLTEAESVITDTFGVNQQYVSGSLVVYEIEIDAEGNEASATPISEGFTFTLTDDGSDPASQTGFTISFTDGIEKAYRIVYQTEAVDRVFENTRVTNTANFNNETVTAGRNIQQMILSKTHDQVNYADKTVRWTIRVNRDSYEMNDLVLDDIFTNEGLTYRAGTLAISDDDGVYAGVYEFVLTYDALNPTVQTGFRLSFVDPVIGPLTITFVTDFDYEQRADENLNYFENRVTATWRDEDDQERTLSVTRRFTPDTYTQANGFKGGSYNAVTKEITWTVGVNYNLQTVEGAAVTDFILGDQTLITDSIRVYEAVLGGGSNQITRGDQLADPNIVLLDISGNELVNPDETAYGFRVFLGDITTAYIIEYITSIDNRLIVAEYENTAYLRDSGNNLHAELDASVSVQGGGTYTGKTAVQAGRIIQWSMVINPGQSALSEARVEDELSAGQIFLRDSLALYATNVDINGNLTRGTRLEEGTHYILDVTVSDDHLVEGDTFILSFLGDIDRAYILEYQTFALVGNNQTVSNSATLYAAEEGLPEDTGSSEGIVVRITAGQGGIDGELGNLTIRKISANDDSLLPGAEFDLFHESGDFRIATGITDENGLLAFNNLVYGTYYIREVNAPEGYLIRFAETEVTIDDTENAVDILNDLIIRDVQLLKTDAAESNSNRTIAGAVFELRDSEGNLLGQYETDQNGVIYIADLDPGDYSFVEITAAPYYQLDSTPVDFSIQADQIAVLELSKENTFISVGLTKTDDFDSSILITGVPFRLEDSDGNIIYDRLETDQNGRIEVAGLLPGEYRFIELEPAPHYLPDETPVDFEVVANQIETLELTKENRLIPGAIDLLKVDDKSGKPLAGAVFRLIYENGLVVYDDLITDENGRLFIDNLRPGNYELVELKAPAGYYLPRDNSTLILVELADLVSNDGDIQELEIGNSKIVLSGSYFDGDLLSNLMARVDLPDPDKIALPQTGGVLSTKLLIALACLLALIGLAIRPKSGLIN